MSVQSQILASDYNAIRSKIVSILGTGLSQRGYGQQIFSSPVEPQFIVTSAQWEALRTDLFNISLHQTGGTPSLTRAVQGDLIEFGPTSPNNAYDIIAELFDQNKFSIAASRSTITTVASSSFTGIWKDLAETVLTIQFNNSDQARYFFNSGGKIRFISTRTGGSNSPQNTSWSNLLNAAGTFQFGANIPEGLNFYSLTNQYQTTLNIAPGGIYQANIYKIEARCNVVNNSTGSANKIEFKISWVDDYVPTFQLDRVDGTLSLTIEELKATGNIVPTGSFTIVSPTYALNNITAN